MVAMTTEVDNEDTEKWSEGSLDDTEVTDNTAFNIVIRSDLNVQSVLKEERIVYSNYNNITFQILVKTKIVIILRQNLIV